MPVPGGLRRHGWEVTTVVEEDTLGDTHEEHFRYAAGRDWPSLAFDDDVRSLVDTQMPALDNAGILYVSQYGHTVGELVGRLESCLHQHLALAGEVIFTQVRLREVNP